MYDKNILLNHCGALSLSSNVKPIKPVNVYPVYLGQNFISCNPVWSKAQAYISKT